MIRRPAGRSAARAAARAGFRIAGVLAAAALIIVAAPVSLVAGGSAAAAWLAGWPPGRLYRAGLWCVPMLVVWLAATAIATRSASQVAEAPYLAWLAMWHRGAAGSYPAAAAVIAPPAIPVGLAAGGLCWAYRIRSMETGSGGLAPDSAATFDLRQWRHQARSARARIAAPGAVPLTTQNEALVAGAVIRTVGHPARRIASIPYARMRSHQVVIGTTGTGKTTLLLRLWAGFMATALRRSATGRGQPPLLVVLDCKGGADARRIADRARRVLRVAGARSTAIWPDEASLSLWALPPAQLTTTLVDLIEHGTGAAAYYADVMEAVVGLAVAAPCGPPGSTADFLARLDPGWLTAAYSSGPYPSGEHEGELALVRAAARQLGDIGLRFRTLFRRLGGGLDGPGGFGDADAWYCILEGTAEVAVAEAQARALVDLLASYAARRPSGPGQAGPGDRREILLAVDESSTANVQQPIDSSDLGHYPHCLDMATASQPHHRTGRRHRDTVPPPPDAGGGYLDLGRVNVLLRPVRRSPLREPAPARPLSRPRSPLRRRSTPGRRTAESQLLGALSDEGAVTGDAVDQALALEDVERLVHGDRRTRFWGRRDRR